MTVSALHRADSPARVHPLIEPIARALHPLAAPPSQPAWNLAELAGLLPANAPRAGAAVLVALIEHPGEPRVLFTRRHEQLSRHGGQVSFPGGRVDTEDTSPVDTALREAWEEVGLPFHHVDPLGFLDPYDTISAFRVIPVVARVQPGFTLRPDPDEVAEVFEVPLAFLLNPANRTSIRVDFSQGVRECWEFRCNAHRIWGATAAILVNLQQRLAEVK